VLYMQIGQMFPHIMNSLYAFGFEYYGAVSPVGTHTSLVLVCIFPVLSLSLARSTSGNVSARFVPVSSLFLCEQI
jgi:hypothetical protein